MKPLNYAVLKYLTTVPEACADDVINALLHEYGRFKALNEKDVLNALMTAKANGLLEESRFEEAPSVGVRVYFRAHAEGAATISRYIPD